MIPANLAKSVFTFIQNQVTKIVLIKQRTTILLSQDEVGRPFTADVSVDTDAEFSCQLLISREAFRIDVDFPPRTAGVTAF